jgi:uncharacterized repeat protein (TIGR03803 family)
MFYGTTGAGGSSNNGTIFEITPAGGFTMLYSFAGYPDGGSLPEGLVQAPDGNYYGITVHGGANCADGGCGTFFKIMPGGVPITLYSFCTQATCLDGAYPLGLIRAANGNFYGTTLQGGTYDLLCGTVFEITATGKLTSLHSFNHSDGCQPSGPLIQGADGNFYGTTNQGGTHGEGAFFKMNPAGKLTGFYSFCSQPNCADGYRPVAVLQATDGNLYGTTAFGGLNRLGTIFQITPEGSLTTLHSFAGADGSLPTSLMQATDGNLYGTTQAGGIAKNSGSVFRLSMDLLPFAKLTQNSGKVGQSAGILGQNFTGTTNVSFNGTPASFTVVSDTYIRATVPAGATTGFATVSTPSGTLTSNVAFQVMP